MSAELETVLISKFNFPVEMITLKRYKNQKSEVLYEFDPFLYEVQEDTKKSRYPILIQLLLQLMKMAFRKRLSKKIDGIQSEFILQ